jgi:CRISPR-associated exonuclease Cas4
VDTGDEEDLIPLSYLSQYYYCPRRAALLMVEQQWADNVHTAEGTLLHQRVDSGLPESRGEVLTLRSLSLRSLRLGLAGKTDCVEATLDPAGVSLPGYEGRWRLRPVEYKHGERRTELEYEVQLCAQAMCLEEMLGASIGEGDLFYAADHRRVSVTLGSDLRKKVEDGARALHVLLREGRLPAPRWSSKCRGCSLVDICGPRLKRSATAHLEQLAAAAQGDA